LTGRTNEIYFFPARLQLALQKPAEFWNICIACCLGRPELNLGVCSFFAPTQLGIYLTMAPGKEMLETGDELVFGLVTAVGADLDCVIDALRDGLSQVRYESTVIKVSSLVNELDGDEWQKLPESPEEERIKSRMDAGNKLREGLKRGDAMALLSVGRIREERDGITGGSNKPAMRRAWILRSLKNPAEVETLRTIYGRSFFLIGAYCPRQQRVQNLAMRIANSKHDLQSSNYRNLAEALIQRDESEIGNSLGQNVRDTFPMSDAFVDVSDSGEARHAILRFVEIIFGYQFHTPTREEFGIFQAHGAAMRSASLGRQVGSAITTQDGGVIAVGTNEVPKAGGGHYWAGDDPDRRDFRLGKEINDVFKQNLLGDVLTRLQKNQWLNEEKTGVKIEELLKNLTSTRIMKDAHLMSIIEFMRCVHAEMAAIVDAARRGIAIGQAVMYCTTFPCHECAKHIVAAGLRKVVYIDPYPKSRVSELYPDSITVEGIGPTTSVVVFQPFVGIAPRRYLELFAMRERKDPGSIGLTASWDKINALPCSSDNEFAVKARISYEALMFDQFSQLLQEKGLARTIQDVLVPDSSGAVDSEPSKQSPKVRNVIEPTTVGRKEVDLQN